MTGQGAHEWSVDDLELVSECPVCLAPASTLFASSLRDVEAPANQTEWSFRRCAGCASLFLNPRPTVAAISRAYRTDTYYTQRAPAPSHSSGTARRWLRVALRNGYLNVRRGYHAQPALRVGAALFGAFPLLAIRSDYWIRHLEQSGGGSRVLDVGCGHGHLVTPLAELGWQVDGIDPDARAVALAQRAGINARVGTLVSLTGQLESGYDAITLSHSIEHVHDPRPALAAAFELLRPGGVLWIATPNCSALGLRVFKGNWRALDPPRHLCVMSRRGLRDMLEDIGFESIRSPIGPPRARLDWRNSLAVNHGRRRRVTLPKRAFVEVCAVMADTLALVRPELAEESVVVARRPSRGDNSPFAHVDRERKPAP